MVSKYNNLRRSNGMLSMLTAAAFVLRCANSAQADTGDPLKCDFSGIESPMITVKIENADLTGAELKVPRNYLMSRAIDGATRDALLLQVWKDSFLPYTLLDARGEDQSKKLTQGSADNMTILISSLKDLSTIAELNLQFLYSAPSDLKANRTQPVSGPLVRLQNGMSGYRNEHGLLEQQRLPISRFSEVILGDENHEITDVFLCDRIGDVPFPFCTHIFESGVYDVKITYKRSDLPRARELKQKTEQLLACLTAKQPEQR